MPKDGLGRTPLHFSAWNGQEVVTKILIDAVDSDKNLVNLHSYKENNFSTPLDYAATYGHENIVKYLLKSSESTNIRIDTVNENGDNAFHQVCSHGHTEIANVLLLKL